MKNRALLYVIVLYILIVAAIFGGAYLVFTIVGCGEIPTTQQTGTTKTTLVRLVKVDKDGSKTYSDVKKVNVKQ